MYHLFVTTFPQLNLELLISLSMVVITALVIAAYSIRVWLKGKAQFDRIDKQGGSALFSKDAMQGGYWFLQPLGRALVFFHVTPNMVSWSSFFFGALAGGCLAAGHFGSAACFATLSAVLDALDGMVARFTGLSSDAGEVLDAAVDRYVEFFMLAGLVIYYREIPVLMVLALAALIGSFMVSYSSAKAEAMNVDPPKGTMRRPERALYLILGAAFSPVTIPWLERVREFPIPIAHPMVMALGLIGVLSNVSAVERFWAIAKQIRVREAAAAAEARRQASLAEHHGEADDEAAHEPVTR
jgi:CDP-diacylglycerol--glycerol-3-phosphate 3-phosphatidyltransferase